MQTTDTNKEEQVDCLPKIIYARRKITAASHKKQTQEMCRKQITSIKSEKIFCGSSVKSEQNKFISGRWTKNEVFH